MKKQILNSFLILSTFGLGWVSANNSLETQESIEEKIERFEAQSGLEVFGTVHGEFFRSEVDGDLFQSEANQTQLLNEGKIANVDAYGEKVEKTQVTRFDLGFNFRPYENTQAKALLRFSQDWQTFFASRSRPVSVRWLSMEGSFNKMFKYNVGDFKQKYSPLTLWTPELEFIMEPRMFARDRQELMREHFLDGNERLLQGANMNFTSGNLGDIAELRLDGLFSRVRRAEYLDSEGKQSKEANYKSDFENFVAATQFEALVMDNIFIGAGFLHNFDQAGTFLTEDQLTEQQALVIDSATAADNLIDPNMISQNGNLPLVRTSTSVVSGKGGLDIAGLSGLNSLTFEVLGEFAQSVQSYEYANDARTLEGLPLQEDLTGSAMWAELGLGYSTETMKISSNSKFINNDQDYRNPFAQSTQFVPERVMNTSNDDGTNALYSSLDALYHGVSHYSPTVYETANQVAPYEKNSYTNSIQYGNVAVDPNLQNTLASGLATANRVGLIQDIGFNLLDGGVQVKLAYKGLAQASPNVLQVDSVNAFSNDTEFEQMAFGLGVDASKFISYDHPLEVTGSYTKDVATTNSTQNASGIVTNLGETNVYTSELVQIGAYFKVHRLFALLGGFQTLTGTNENLLDPSFASIEDTRAETYWRAGGEFAVGQNAYFMITSGILSVDTDAVFTALDGTEIKRSGSFSQLISQFKIRADF